MKVVLFCGGEGLRMRDVTGDVPKPMVMLGNRPMLWHVMKYYAHWGHKDFVLCLGYKGAAIKEYFVQYQEWISNDFVLSKGGRRLELLRRDLDEWRITFVDTGPSASIGERLLAVRPLVQHEPMFLANYSDGLTDCPLPSILHQLEATGAVAVCMAARPNLSIHFLQYSSKGLVTSVVDAVQADSWINAGFFALRSEIFDYLQPGEDLVMDPFQRLIALGKLATLPYAGFWRCCDTFKDLRVLESLLAGGVAPWEIWRQPARHDEQVKPAPVGSAAPTTKMAG